MTKTMFLHNKNMGKLPLEISSTGKSNLGYNNYTTVNVHPAGIAIVCILSLKDILNLLFIDGNIYKFTK